jgi:hypothetical protein
VHWKPHPHLRLDSSQPDPARVRSNSSPSIHFLAQSACAETRLESLNSTNQINRRRRIDAIVYDSTIWHHGHPEIPMPRWFFGRRSLKLFLRHPLASSKRVRRNAPGISQPQQSDQLEGGGFTQLYTIRSQSGIAGILRCRCRVDFFGRRSVGRIGGCSRGCRGRMLRCKLPGYSIFFLRNMFSLLLLHTSTREVCGADWGERGGREWTAWRAAYSSSPRREVPGESSEHISQLVSVYMCGSTREGCNKADCVVVEKQACRWRFRFEVQFHEHIHSMYACEEE